MKIPSKLLTGDKDKDSDILRFFNRITNIIWQSERESFQDCELIMEQIIMELFKKGYLKTNV